MASLKEFGTKDSDLTSGYFFPLPNSQDYLVKFGCVVGAELSEQMQCASCQ